ncbi:MAG: superoxide dismutase [Salinivirgaceae bacterium]|nr:superoxide dismutase [Salinivirgaceae bacterium]
MSIIQHDGKFLMPQLAYGANDLSPVISGETFEYHYGKHLQAYVNNLNAALHGSGFENSTLEDIVRQSSGGIFNNAGQVLNHTLYFQQFKAPKEDNAPMGKIAAAIDSTFGSFDKFKAEFEAKGVSLFGSGWVWLSADANGKLVITQEVNAGNPVTANLRPLLTFDVWEHAYYIDYRNARAGHLKALWSIIDWKVIEERFNS